MPAGTLPDVSPGKKKENNAMKKMMIAFLAVMLVCSGIFSASFAETSGMYEYTLKEDGTAEITKVDPNCKDKEIPSELDGHPVTSIGEIAFSQCNKLTDLIIPEGITSIGPGAFFYCAKLKSVSIPDSVVLINNCAFADCPALTGFKLSPSHPVYAFSNSALISKKDMTLIQYAGKGGDYEVAWGITRIGDSAFADSKVKSVLLPDSVTSIGFGAFSTCFNLSSINIPGSVTAIGNQAFYGSSKLKSIFIPASVTDIGSEPFVACGTLNIEISPDNQFFEVENGNLIYKNR